ncbi:hypothetical protein [Nocardioides sp. SYSU DS0651]|uniref:hypothetical protein n=1 Tax=Nocardioides sp. SYSU DS0651 TaxID=3415955 RepID=UPI003F4BFB31
MPVPSRTSINVSLPPRWATRTDPARGIVVAARCRERPPGGFPPELVVRAVPVDSDLLTWRRDALTTMGLQLVRFDLEDEDRFGLGDHEVLYRRFSHHLAGTDLVGEQWSWLVDGVGVTLTATVARSDYPAYCDVFEDVAATVEVVPAAAA